MNKLTIFTPTFNRANNLPTLYKVLLNQTSQNFLWLIIDDGSTDETKILVESWIKDQKLNIEYIYKENGGKHTAIEVANNLCKTDYIVIIDSDDILTNNAVETFYEMYQNVDNDELLIGILFPRVYMTEELVRNDFPKTGEKKFLYEINNYNYRGGEVNHFLKTNIIKKFGFPHFSGEKFVRESVWTDNFFYDHKFWIYSKAINLLEYTEDGYTKQGFNLLYKNPYGFLCALKSNAYYAIKARFSLKEKVIATAKYYGWAKAMRLNKKKIEGYKISFFYRFSGRILSLATRRVYKKRIKECQR